MRFIFKDLKSGSDNRNLIDDGKSQKLSKEEIYELVDSGASGQEVIAQFFSINLILTILYKLHQKLNKLFKCFILL